MSQPPPPKGPETQTEEAPLQVELEVVKEVRRSVPPRPRTRSSRSPLGSVPPTAALAPAPLPEPEVMVPIAAMPIISLGTISDEASDSVKVGASGLHRSSVPPPPMRPPADSFIQPVSLPLPEVETPGSTEVPILIDEGPPVDASTPEEQGPTIEVDHHDDEVIIDEAEPLGPASVPENDVIPDVLIESAPASQAQVLPPADPPPDDQRQDEEEHQDEEERQDDDEETQAPVNRTSEIPPEVDPEDMEIHDIASPGATAKQQPPPVRSIAVPIPIPLPTQGPDPTAEAPFKRARYWWDELFGDDFLRTMDRLTDKQVKAEVNFIEDSLAVQKGGIILDLACGTGRHAVEMASRGYNVVGYDLSVAMLARAQDEAHERAQKLNFLQGDMREMGFEEMFDGVFCWSTSFGYFDDEKNQVVATRIHRSLRKGGMLLLDLANRDFVTQRQPSLVWFEGEGCVCMDEMRVDFITSRLKVKRMVMLEDGRTREMDYSIRLYTLHELGRMLHDVGFKVAEVSGHPATPGVFMGADSPRLIVLAEKA